MIYCGLLRRGSNTTHMAHSPTTPLPPPDALISSTADSLSFSSLSSTAPPLFTTTSHSGPTFSVFNDSFDPDSCLSDDVLTGHDEKQLPPTPIPGLPDDPFADPSDNPMAVTPLPSFRLISSDSTPTAPVRKRKLKVDLVQDAQRHLNDCKERIRKLSDEHYGGVLQTSDTLLTRASDLSDAKREQAAAEEDLRKAKLRQIQAEERVEALNKQKRQDATLEPLLREYLKAVRDLKELEKTPAKVLKQL
jgi:hypothetical protein